ncbi:hypothetical protein [Streptomyces sp. NBC_01190]|uniref:hypothetical protein n=1 Tax=Streptomyces sp. NBC_01190 TaxID=2903767 RepID=UPI00386F3DA8|nr:hypothetical protein OG519_21520 [Streptomyces sp. NBC_01190]
MSANYPPPQPPQPTGQNPYAQQPQGQAPGVPGAPGAPGSFGPPQPGATPYGAPAQPGTPGGFDPAGYPPPGGPMVAAAPPPNVALAVLAGIAAALVVAFAYGWIIGSTKHEIGYAALGVGFAVGAVVGKVGGRSPALPYVGVVLALLGVFLGQFLGEAIIGAHEVGISVTSALTDYTHEVFLAWKDDFDVMSFFFMVLAGVTGFQMPRRING